MSASTCPGPASSQRTRELHTRQLHTRRRRTRSPLLAVAAVLAVMAALVAGCAADDTGSGYHLAADQLTTSTTAEPGTTTTTAAPVDHTVQVAAAKGATVDVYSTKAGDPTSTIPAPPAGHVQPIPRAGLNSAGSRKTATGYQFDNPTYFGNPLTFLVTEDAGDWLKVLLPARPNHSEGWVRASDVTVTEHDYRIEIDVAGAKLRAYDGEQVLADTYVVVGAPGSPTPKGLFYVNEKIPQSNAGGSFGPWILSTNGYSEDKEFFRYAGSDTDGLPVVALHGTNQPGLLGSAASNGCVRMPNDVVTMLATTIPAGTPIIIA